MSTFIEKHLAEITPEILTEWKNGNDSFALFAAAEDAVIGINGRGEWEVRNRMQTEIIYCGVVENAINAYKMRVKNK